MLAFSHGSPLTLVTQRRIEAQPFEPAEFDGFYQNPITQEAVEMMSEARYIVHRIEDRYQICDSEQVTVEMKYTVDGELKAFPVELHDLSRYGAKLCISCGTALEGEFELTVELPEADLGITTAATLQWIRPHSDGQWWVGCSFADQIDKEILEELAIDGHLERRYETRSDVSVPFTARRELTPAGIPVRVVDISKGGFCLVASQEFESGERLLLEIDRGQEVEILLSARAKWCRKVGTEYWVGCEFLTHDGFAALRPFTERKAKTLLLRPTSFWIWVATAASVLWYVWNYVP